MKIEMGESLFYSWLRHVKNCQIVQTNWKVSPRWKMSNKEKLTEVMIAIDQFFSFKYGYKVFKGNSFDQLLLQGECDVLGVQSSLSGNQYYAIDVAFHENGLQYGDKKTTIMKVIEKCTRTAFCLYGFLGATDSEIAFASPKIGPSLVKELEICISELNHIFVENGFNYVFCLIANEEFNSQVLQPILLAGDEVADTSELFLRSIQLYQLFSKEKKTTKCYCAIKDSKTADSYAELKIGQLAQLVLMKALRDGKATQDEVEKMQILEYSKDTFGIHFPLLTSEKQRRYYASPILIYGQEFYLCSEWFEASREKLLHWLDDHP